MAPLELWGGPECSLNRVGKEFQNQLEFSGHQDRLSDLDLFARLGLKKLRYPVLWEALQPDPSTAIDWTWTDERLGRLRELGMVPIVGLVHHGSGPAWCSFETKAFPQGLAEYARKVALRYPWVEYYTPVNEPLTTARFAGLYGLWHPHEKSDKGFVSILLNEIKGTILAMRAIREVNPKAKLVQTEDLGKAQSTPELAYQAEFENLRRWLTFDLLCGKVTPRHGLYAYLTKRGGATPRELTWFEDNALPPDVIGLNHYVTSERFLDQRSRLYPGHPRGSNGRQRYVDIETVRVKDARRYGFDYLMREAWVRYGLPLALTEVHIGCTREEQMRWFMEAWKSAEFLHQSRVPVLAVTAWSLIGSFNWNCLLTHRNGCYESGVFDIKNGQLRRTALADLIEAIGNGNDFHHPVLEGKGWWDRPIRHGDHSNDYTPNNSIVPLLSDRYRHEQARKTILITGATGTLGRAFLKVCRLRGLNVVLTNRQQLDIANPASVEEALRKYRPWAVINTAGYVRVDDAEQERERCFRENALGPEILAAFCARHGTRLVTFSSDLVFGAASSGPYSEEARPDPANVYGASKAKGEKAVLESFPSALVIRTSAFFGPWDRHNFVHHVLENATRGKDLPMPMDVIVSATYVPDLVNTTLNLLIDGERGIWHLVNEGSASWYELGKMVCDYAELDSDFLKPILASDLNQPAFRPADTSLVSSRGRFMPSLEASLRVCVREQLNLSRLEEVEELA